MSAMTSPSPLPKPAVCSLVAVTHRGVLRARLAKAKMIRMLAIIYASPSPSPSKSSDHSAIEISEAFHVSSVC
jgi:hypothetical protein